MFPTFVTEALEREAARIRHDIYSLTVNDADAQRCFQAGYEAGRIEEFLAAQKRAET